METRLTTPSSASPVVCLHSLRRGASFPLSLAAGGNMPDGSLNTEASVTLWLKRCDPTRRMLRLYAAELTPDLFGGWSLRRSWGRIGTAGGCGCK
jgi:hypothetical protein